MNTVGTNTAQSTSAIAISGRADLVHALARRVARRKAGRHVALDILDHDDGIVDHDADREHEPEQRQIVQREAERRHDAKVPISETGIAINGMMAARQVCRNRMTTSITSTMASTSVSITASTDCRMNWVGL